MEYETYLVGGGGLMAFDLSLANYAQGNVMSCLLFVLLSAYYLRTAWVIERDARTRAARREDE